MIVHTVVMLIVIVMIVAVTVTVVVMVAAAGQFDQEADPGGDREPPMIVSCACWIVGRELPARSR